MYDDYYRRKRKRPSFADLTVGHKFEILYLGKMPEGEKAHCAFCGGRMKYFFQLKRDDGLRVRVGKTCVGKVEITNPSWQPIPKKGEMEEVGNAEKAKKEAQSSSDEELLRLLDDI